jgi:hypothetical protein
MEERSRPGRGFSAAGWAAAGGGVCWARQEIPVAGMSAEHRKRAAAMSVGDFEAIDLGVRVMRVSPCGAIIVSGSADIEAFLMRLTNGAYKVAGGTVSCITFEGPKPNSGGAAGGGWVAIGDARASVKE